MLWLKALHLIFMVTWFAGLFYLPRLYVYLSETDSQQVRETLRVMADKLYIIMTIGMLATWVFGIATVLAADPDYRRAAYLGQGWLHAKIAIVFLLSGYHGWLKFHLKRFRAGTNAHSGRYWRIANEVPALVLVAVVVLAVVRPF